VFKKKERKKKGKERKRLSPFFVSLLFFGVWGWSVVLLGAGLSSVWGWSVVGGLVCHCLGLVCRWGLVCQKRTKKPKVSR
jgi:hypothetical protein